MGFSELQQKLLGAKLDGRHVRARQKDGIALLYVEGWHAVAEANRIFGFDGWDRETLTIDCVHQGAFGGTYSTFYRARVRLRVRAGETIIARDGSGFGFGQAPNPADAHELALKDAETDATKRALATFGNPFGLALYDRSRRAVKNRHLIEGPQQRSWILKNTSGEVIAACPDPPAFCAALRRTLQATTDAETTEAVWRANHPAVMELVEIQNLKTRAGVHYAELLARVYADHVDRLLAKRAAEPGEQQPSQPNDRPAADSPALGLDRPRRIRDEAHRRFVAKQPCLVCGRAPAHAHHLRFAQPRALAKKVSDEWTVPLCVIHHRALHEVGDEEKWWREHGIEPLEHATKLWDRTHESSAGSDRQQEWSVQRAGDGDPTRISSAAE